jgi:hypothetical protein
MADTFDAMLERLERNAAAQRRFVETPPQSPERFATTDEPRCRPRHAERCEGLIAAAPSLAAGHGTDGLHGREPSPSSATSLSG